MKLGDAYWRAGQYRGQATATQEGEAQRQRLLDDCWAAGAAESDRHATEGGLDPVAWPFALGWTAAVDHMRRQPKPAAGLDERAKLWERVAEKATRQAVEMLMLRAAIRALLIGVAIGAITVGAIWLAVR